MTARGKYPANGPPDKVGFVGFPLPAPPHPFPTHYLRLLRCASASAHSSVSSPAHSSGNISESAPVSVQSAQLGTNRCKVHQEASFPPLLAILRPGMPAPNPVSRVQGVWGTQTLRYPWSGGQHDLVRRVARGFSSVLSSQCLQVRVPRTVIEDMWGPNISCGMYKVTCAQQGRQDCPIDQKHSCRQ